MVDSLPAEFYLTTIPVTGLHDVRMFGQLQKSSLIEREKKNESLKKSISFKYFADLPLMVQQKIFHTSGDLNLTDTALYSR